MFRHYSNNRRHRGGARDHTPHISLICGGGDHAPHINLIYVDGDVHVELKKKIQSGEQRTLILKAEQFFDISFKSDDILKAGREMAGYRGRNSEKQPPSEVGSFRFILRSDYDSHKYEHLYEWEVPNSDLRVSVRNRRSDGKRPRDTEFVVEVRVFNARGRPTEEGIMMAWHNFNGTFVHNRAERRNRIQEMRRNGVLNVTPSFNISERTTIGSVSATTVSSTMNLPQWIIDEQFVNKDTHTCVICMDTYMKGDQVNGLPHCSHYFHANCIKAWLVGSHDCPVCRSKV